MIQSGFNMAHFGIPNGQGHEEHWRATPSSGSKKDAQHGWIPNTLPILDRATGIFPQVRTPSLKTMQPKREITQTCSTVQLVNCSTNLEALDAPTFLCKSDLHKYFPPMDMFKGHHKVIIFWTWDCKPFTSCYTSCYVIHLLQYNSIHIDHLFQSSSTQFNTYTRYISGIYTRYFKKSPAPAWRAGSRIRRRRGNLRGSCLGGLAFVTGEAAKHCWIRVICNYPIWWYDRYITW